MSADTPSKEPLILWWMPVLSVLGPLGYAAWEAVSSGIGDAVVGFFWPGVLFYLGTMAVLWAGWKIELE